MKMKSLLLLALVLLCAANLAWAAPAHDASSESDTGTAGWTTTNPKTWTHTPSGTPRGVLIGCVAFNTINQAVFREVTYGGVQATSYYEWYAQDTAGEFGQVKLYFLGSNIPTGAQTVSVTNSASTDEKWCAVATITASLDTKLVGEVLLQEDGTLAEQSVDSGASTGQRYALCFSGITTPPAVGSNTTSLQTMDRASGTDSAAFARETNAGSGSRSVGFSDGTTDDRACVHVAVIEQPTTGYPYVKTTAEGADNSLTITVNLPGGIASGDVLECYITSNAGITSHSWPAGWTEKYDTDNSTVVGTAATRIADGTEGSTITVTASGVADGSVHVCLRIVNWHGTTVPEFGTAATGTTSNADPPSVTASWGSANNLFVAAGHGADSNNFTSTSASYTRTIIRRACGGAPTCSIAVTTRELTAASDNPGVITWGATQDWVAETSVVRPVNAATSLGALLGIMP